MNWSILKFKFKWQFCYEWKLWQIRLYLFNHGFCTNMACFLRMDGNFKVVHVSISGRFFSSFSYISRRLSITNLLKNLNIFKLWRVLALILAFHLLGKIKGWHYRLKLKTEIPTKFYKKIFKNLVRLKIWSFLFCDIGVQLNNHHHFGCKLV